MRRGTVKRKCSTCNKSLSVQSNERTCPVDAGHRIVWAFTVDIAPEGAPRKQVGRSGFESKKDALAAMAELQVEAVKGDRVDPSKITLGDYLTDRWLPAIEGNRRESTMTSYRDVVRIYIVPHIGDVRLQQVTADLLTRLYGQLERSGGKGGKALSRRTVRYAHVVIGKALKDAERWRLIRRNPAPLADSPSAKTTKPKAPKAWTAAELTTFLDHVVDDRLRPLWHFFATTGVRRGEAAGLRWSNVDLDAGTVSIIETRASVNYRVVEGEPKTDKGKRLIALDAETVKVLREWRRVQNEERLALGAAWPDTGHVWTREDGQPWHPDRISKMFEQRVAAAGLPHLPVHGMRHTSASVGLANGVPLKVMQERLGHSSMSITADIYSHVSPGMDREAAEAIAAAIGGGS